MPRKTRAAAKAQKAVHQIHEDDTETSLIDDAQEQASNTVQLQIGEKVTPESASEKPEKDEEKKTGGGKKKRNNRKRNKKSKESNQFNLVTIPNDEDPSSTPPTVGISPTPEHVEAPVSPTRRTRAVAKLEEEAAAATADSQQDADLQHNSPEILAEKATTPVELHPEIQPVVSPTKASRSPSKRSEKTVQPQDQSSQLVEEPAAAIEPEHVASPAMRSPSPHKLDSIFQQPSGREIDNVAEHPFAAMMARSPAKSPSRSPVRLASRSPSKSPQKQRIAKEDPIDAMDAMEDAEDVVRELSRTRASTICHDAAPSMDIPVADTEVSTPVAEASSKPKSPTKVLERQSRPTAPKSVASRPSSFAAPKTSPAKTVASLKPAPKSVKSSITALHTPQKIAKSTKAPTVPTFSLAGDAVREKLKAAREERQKRREEEEQKSKNQTVGRGATIPKAKAVESHATLPFRQRQSMAPKADESKAGIVPAKPVVKPLSSTLSPSKSTKPARPVSQVISKPGNGVTIPKSRPSSMILGKASDSSVNAKSGPSSTIKSSMTANTARPRAPIAATAAPIKSNTSRPVKPKIAAAGTIPAPSAATKPSEQERMEAAKRARAEAAERGRLASQKWAAQMKQKTQPGVQS